MNSQAKKKPVLISGFVLLSACVICTVILIPTTKKDTAPVIVTNTKEVIASHTQTPQPESQASIPGLSPADIKVNLEEKRFECTAAQEAADPVTGEYYFWDCKRKENGIELFVHFNGRSLTTVDFITATLIGEDPQSSFLKYMATMPFVGNTELQDQAKAWVETSIPLLTGEPGDIQSTIIGGVNIELLGPQTARTIQIGKTD